MRSAVIWWRVVSPIDLKCARTRRNARIRRFSDQLSARDRCVANLALLALVVPPALPKHPCSTITLEGTRHSRPLPGFVAIVLALSELLSVPSTWILLKVLAQALLSC